MQRILDLVKEYVDTHNEKNWQPGVDWVRYAGPYFDSKEITAAVETLLKGWLVLGEDAIKFEKRFALLLGKNQGVVTNSGSSSNLLMMLAAKKYYNLKDGEKVIVPVAGFPTTFNPILQAGLTPIFVDIELDTLNINLDQFDTAVNQGARIVTFAHVLGNPPNMDFIQDMMSIHNLILLEDCCDALGTTYDGKLLGGYGQLSSCSFYPAHHMTMGEGGFVATNDKKLEKIVRSLREWGRGCFCVGAKANLSMKGMCGHRFKNWIPSLPNEVFDHKYIYDNIGYNLKPIELQCSIGLVQIEKLPEIHRLRKENHKRLTKIFAPYEEFFHIHKAQPKADVSWFAFPVTIKDGVKFKRSEFTSYLEQNKIQTRNYFGGNLLLQPAYSHLATPEIAQSFKVATKVTKDTFFLGTSPVVKSYHLDYIEEVVNKFFKNL